MKKKFTILLRILFLSTMIFGQIRSSYASWVLTEEFIVHHASVEQVNAFITKDRPAIKLENNLVTLETQKILITFDLSTYGSLVRIKNHLTNQEFQFQNLNHPFWTIDLLDYLQIEPTNPETFDYEINESTMIFRYQLAYASELIDVILTIQIDRPHLGINLKLETSGLSNLPGIRGIYLPMIHDVTQWALTKGDEQIAIPEREGWLITDAINTINSRSFVRSYPGTLSMQFLVLSEPEVGGFVISALDMNSRHKEITLHSGVDLNWYHYSDNMVFNGGNNFTMDYWVVIDAYQGKSWAAGAELYKKWAMEQWYIQKGIINERKDIPAWLKTIDYVWKGSSYATNPEGRIVLEGETVDKMGKFPPHLKQKGLSTNFLLEWVGWGRDGFDRGYPEYFPARDGDQKLKQGIDDVHQASTKVMLYFNGRLVDVTTDTYTNNTAYLTSYFDNIYTESYSSHFTAAVADPSSAWWQELVKNFTVTAIKDYNVDIVYLDQISVAPPMFDYRDVPSHPPGSGSWWQKAENQLLNNTRTAIQLINPNTGLGSENVLETYLNNVDLFWSYQTSYDMTDWFPQGRAIPLFSFIYHPYTIISGRPDINPVDFELYFWATSESLKNGYIPGAATLQSPSRFSIRNQAYSALKAAYLTRKIGNYQFFRDGELLYPVEWIQGPEVTIRGYEKYLNVPQGIIQGYKSRKSDEYAILFANRGSTDLTWNGNLSTLLVDSGADPLSVKSLQEILFYTNGVEETLSAFPTAPISLKIPAYSFVVLVMKTTPFEISISTTALLTISLTNGFSSHQSSGFMFTLILFFMSYMGILKRRK